MTGTQETVRGKSSCPGLRPGPMERPCAPEEAYYFAFFLPFFFFDFLKPTLPALGS